MSRAKARWEKRQEYAAWEKALERASENAAPAEEVFDVVEPRQPPEQPAPPKDLWWIRFKTLEEAWRWDAHGAGLSAKETEESWVWYRRNAFGAGPVLQETERPLPETMPDSVRRVLAQNIRYVFLAEDPFVDELLEEFEQPIPNDLQQVADDWQFWDDVGKALRDSRETATRWALNRLARLVRLKPAILRQLANNYGSTMQATKRLLVHKAVLLSLAGAEERIRIGRRTVNDDPGHPITLEEVFGQNDLDDILADLSETGAQPIADARDELARSLGGPFRPAHLGDLGIYRDWLTTEIRRQAGKLLTEELGADTERAGGSRRKEVPYDENEPLTGVAAGPLGAETQAFTEREMRAIGEKEDQEQASFRAADDIARRIQGAAKKDRLEESLASRIDWRRLMDEMWQAHEQPVVRQYIEAVRDEPLLKNDDVAAARQLHWTETKVRDVKRRFNRQLAQKAAERRWKSLFPKAL